MKTILSISLAAAAWLAVPAAAHAEEGREGPPGAAAPPSVPGHPPLRQDLMRMQTEHHRADMPRRIDMTAEERRQLRRDIREAEHELLRREGHRHGR